MGISVRRWAVLLLLIATALFAPSRAHAKGIEPTHISLPKGPGSIEGLGRNFAPSLASGTSSYGVDIVVPPSAGGFSPRLSLDYDSGGGVSDVGMGWRLGGPPRVRRRTENGLPRFDASDAFEISGLGIPSDLIEVSPNVFRPEFESGAFVRVKRAGDGWEARDKSGATYRFGGGPAYVEAEGPNVATWLLREQVDLHGHRIVYEWDSSTGHAALTRVVWNDYGDDVRNVVSLRYEDRPDPHVLFSAGIKQSLARRLVAIEVTHGGQLVRRYELGYGAGHRSRLESVVVVGRDGTSRLPKLSFQYTEPSFSAGTQVTAMTTPPGVSPADPNVELADLNGDALPDVLVTRSGQYRSYINHDGVAWKGGVDWAASVSPSAELATTGVQLADLDGDGAVDLVVKSGTSDFRYFPAGIDGASFRPSVSIATVPNVTFEDPDVKLVDMDGDRRVDVVITTAAGLAVGYNLGGSNWSAPQIAGVVDPKQPLRFSDGHTRLCDVNGDGVSDLCYLRSQSLVYWLGRGRGRYEPARTATGVPSWDPSSPWELHDLDGDGWVDLVHVGVNQVDIALALGEGKFGAPQTITGTPFKGPNAVVRFADMNGSGTTDIVWIDVSGPPDRAWRYLDLFPAGRGGLLRRIDNGLGKVTTIQYAAAARDAARARDAGKPWTSRMNVAMSVVSRTEMDASLGDPLMVAEYAYRDGAWSPGERTFAGFAGGVDRQIGDAYTPTLVEESTFDVGLEDRTQRGLLLTLEKRDDAGRVFSRMRATYTTRELELGVRYTYKSSEETTQIEGGDESKARKTLTEWEQDAYGNVTREAKWGEVVGSDTLVGQDEAITLRTYANNTADWILGRVATEELQDARGRRVRMRRLYYDGAPFVGLPLGQVTRGDVSREEAWVGPELAAFEHDVATSYDADGRPLETRDARGGGRVFEWDAHDHTTLISESVKLESGLLTERAVFDRANGALVEVTGYSGQTTHLGHDPFGRIAWVARPGDSAERPTVRYQYLEGAPLSRIVTEQRIWSGRDDVDYAEDVVDGAGRKRGSLVRDDAGRWVLAGVSLLDARGNARRTQRARFVGAGEHESVALQVDAPGVNAWHDALGRSVRTRTMLGIESRTVYEPLVKKHWDGAQTDERSPYEHTPDVEMLDGLGRAVARAQTLKGAELRAVFSYDAAGALVSKTDAEGNTARYAYDGRGRRVAVEDPDQGKHTYAFDAMGNLLEHRKPDGTSLRFTYDLAGRERTADWNGDGTPEVTHVWDESDSPLSRGALVMMRDPSGSTENTYDERGRAVKVRFVIGGSAYEIESAYDAQDREYWHQYPDGSSIRIHRNARGLVESYGRAVRFDYEGDGSEVRRAFSTDVVQGSVYDEDGHLRETRVRNAQGGILHHLRWTYDSGSRVIGVEDARPNVEAERSRSEQYTYDNLHRLVGAKGTWGEAAWSYSPSGNLRERKSSVAELDAGAVEYGQGAGPHAMTSIKGRTLRYDILGRMTDDGERQYTWNAVDQLVKVAKGAASVENVFDGTGIRRIRVERDPNGETHTTHFLDDFAEVHDGVLSRFLVHGGQRIAKLSDTNGVPGKDPSLSNERSGGCTTSGRTPAGFAAILLTIGCLAFFGCARRLRILIPLLSVGLALLGCAGEGAEPRPIREGTIQVLGEADELLFVDAIGTLTEQTSGSGQTKGSFATYPYGVKRYDSSSETRKYAGTPRDNGVGLDAMGGRSYAPDLGVWTSADPVSIGDPERGIGASFAANHPYSYAGDAPVTHVDRDGHWIKEAIGLGVGALVGSAVTGGAEAYRQYQETGRVSDIGKVAKHAAVGAGAGALEGLMIVEGVPPMAAGAATGAILGISLRAVDGEQTTVSNVAHDAAWGAASAGFGAEVGRVVNRAAARAVTPKPTPGRNGAGGGDLKAAEAARDAAGQQLGRKHATYVGGHKDGKVVAGCSRNPTGCAEDNVARQLGSDANMTGAKGWRRNTETGELEWKDIPVCKNCQDKYSPSQFPPGTKADPGGAWGQ